MIRKTIVILLMTSINMPLMQNDIAKVPTNNSNSDIEIRYNENSKYIPTYRSIKLEEQLYNKTLENEELKKAKELQIKKQLIADENDRKNNVHVYASDVTSLSNIKKEELSSIFYNIGKGEMSQYSNAFIDAEKEYKINALFLASIVALESGWTSSPGGENGTNLTGYCVYNAQTIGTSFNSGYDSIMNTAKLLREKYLTKGAEYFNGYSVEDINIRYCLYQDMKTTDFNWSIKITNIENLFEKVYHHEIKVIKEA